MPLTRGWLNDASRRGEGDARHPWKTCHRPDGLHVLADRAAEDTVWTLALWVIVALSCWVVERAERAIWAIIAVSSIGFIDLP
jgi:hypothetical protein